MSQNQGRIRPDTPINEEAMIEQKSRHSDIDSVMRKRMEEIMNIQDILSKTQKETPKKQEELCKRELKLEYRERRLAVKEEEIRQSLGDDMSGFRGFEQSDPPVDCSVPLPFTPSSSRQITPTTVSRQRSITPLSESEGKLKREVVDLRQRIREIKEMALFAPLLSLSQSSLKLRELIEHVPKFDGQNIFVTQFIRACRRVLESLLAGLFNRDRKFSR
ncbi:hypothetical protein M0804_014934 [Polistes exclamans]|nr:hypothetical protein M0804_014934 [Polistes exclamans]